MRSDVLSKISSAINSSLPSTVCWRSCSTMGNSAISNQLEAGLIMVKAIKSICKLSLPLSVYGPIRLPHKHSHGFVMTVLGGRCPYLCDRLLLTWQDLHDFVSDWMVPKAFCPKPGIQHSWRGRGLPTLTWEVVTIREGRRRCCSCTKLEIMSLVFYLKVIY